MRSGCRYYARLSKRSAKARPTFLARKCKIVARLARGNNSFYGGSLGLVEGDRKGPHSISKKKFRRDALHLQVRPIPAPHFIVRQLAPCI